MIQIPEIYFQEFWQVSINSKLILFFLGIHYNNINSSGFFLHMFDFNTQICGNSSGIKQEKIKHQLQSHR